MEGDFSWFEGFCVRLSLCRVSSFFVWDVLVCERLYYCVCLSYSYCVGVYVYSPVDAEPTLNQDIISIVGEGDPFSTLSLGHLADVSSSLAALCEDTALRDEILAKTEAHIDLTSDKNLQWCYDTAKKLRNKRSAPASATGAEAEKFYPPGRILYMSGAVFGSDKEVTLREVTAKKFCDLELHPKMLDLSRHAPNRYEAALQRLWKDFSSGDDNYEEDSGI